MRSSDPASAAVTGSRSMLAASCSASTMTSASAEASAVTGSRGSVPGSLVHDAARTVSMAKDDAGGIFTRDLETRARPRGVTLDSGVRQRERILGFEPDMVLPTDVDANSDVSARGATRRHGALDDGRRSVAPNADVRL